MATMMVLRGKAMTDNDGRMGDYLSVFNGHVNNASKRALKAMTKRHREAVRRIKRKGNGIMAIFDQPPTAATRRYVELVTKFVNE